MAVGKRARDEATGATLWHSADGGRLYECSAGPSYFFCTTCDRNGRSPYVGTSGRDLSFKPRGVA